ncbi:hypothetical protein Rhe02_52620 [Rhizocola hellebori]|uniref:Uncharacterized protein n=1 Tax=Rhizocola hellebori TaxID=1392758 RepID=A0A8J3VI41_9ACTN|nr:hypothetical protein Rhe02_52620 [Rhizocola hellebori]
MPSLAMHTRIPVFAGKRQTRPDAASQLASGRTDRTYFDGLATGVTQAALVIASLAAPGLLLLSPPEIGTVPSGHSARKATSRGLGSMVCGAQVTICQIAPSELWKL